MQVQFREENYLEMTLAKSTICAGNKMIFYFFFLLLWKGENLARNPHDSPSKCTWIGSNLRFDMQSLLSSD